jgi:hypothetical protein
MRLANMGGIKFLKGLVGKRPAKVYELIAHQVRSLASDGSVAGEQDADGRVLGVELESGFDALAVVGVLRAVEKFQPVACFKAAGG